MNHDKNNDKLWDAIHRIEISGKNSQDLIQKLFLHSAKYEIVIENLEKKIAARFDQQDKRFDRIEDTLATIVNHLEK